VSRWRVLLLWRLAPTWVDVVLTAAVVVALAWSRFALLASGPWEWDETLFARGMLHFELAAHFPHPPGYPGWLALGLLLEPFVDEPLRALQVASAALSLVALWPLAALGRRVAPPSVAVIAAMAVLVAPGPWLFAVRGFSSTAAATVALCAAAVATGSMEERRRLTLVTVLITASFLIRPILAPGLGVLWLVLVTGRPWRRLLPGVSAGAAMVAVAVAVMVRAEGGVRAFLQPFEAHAGRHFSRLVDNPGGWSELGLVKGLGGGWPAVVLVAAAAGGLVVWARRRGLRQAAAWAAVLVVSIAQLLYLQNRTYARYAVPVQLAGAPLVAAAAAVMPHGVAVAGLLGATVVLGTRAYPLLQEQHTTRFGAWQAVVSASETAARRDLALVVEPELHPFASYYLHLEGGGRLPLAPPLILSPWAPRTWSGIDRPWVVATCHPHLYLEPLIRPDARRRFGAVSPTLRPLTQQRFLSAEVLDNPPLPVRGWWPAEQLSSGQRFMWGRPGAEMWLPPLPPATAVMLDLRPAPGPAPLVLVVNDRRVTEVDGRGPRQRVWIEPRLLTHLSAQRVRLERSQPYPPGGVDARPLAVQLFAAGTVGPGVPWSGSLATERDRSRLRATVRGAYRAESFSGQRTGCWLEPRSVLDLAAGEGRLALQLWAPRPVPPQTEIRIGSRVVAGPLELGSETSVVRIDLGSGAGRHGRLRLEVVSVPYRPADDGRADSRELGVVVGDVDFMPRSRGVLRGSGGWASTRAHDVRPELPTGAGSGGPAG
jgi:hypothetical protein